MNENHNPLDRAHGYTSTLYLLPGSPPRVCKVFNPDCIVTHFPAEREAYERFTPRMATHQRHPADPDKTPELLYRWATQAVEALAFAHSWGVYNCDIHCVNFVLDSDFNLKAADWAGASIDGSRSYSTYRLRHALFDVEGKKVSRRTGITAQTEIFALGPALYYMVAETGAVAGTGGAKG